MVLDRVFGDAEVGNYFFIGSALLAALAEYFT